MSEESGHDSVRPDWETERGWMVPEESTRAIEQRFSTIERTLERAITEWQRERREIRNDMERESQETRRQIGEVKTLIAQQGRFNPALLISAVVLFLMFSGMAGALIMFAVNAQTGPLQTRTDEIGDDQDVIRRDLDAVVRELVREQVLSGLWLDGRLRITGAHPQ